MTSTGCWSAASTESAWASLEDSPLVVRDVTVVVEDDLEAVVVDQVVDLVMSKAAVTIGADERHESVGAFDDGCK